MDTIVGKRSNIIMLIALSVTEITETVISAGR